MAYMKDSTGKRLDSFEVQDAGAAAKTFGKRRKLVNTMPFARSTQVARQIKGYDPVGHIGWYIDNSTMVTSADHGVTYSAAQVLPTGVTAANIRKVLRAGGYIWLGGIDTADGRTKVWRTVDTASPYSWSAPLVTMTYLGGLLQTGMSADDQYLYIGDYSDPQGGAHVWRAPLTTGVFTDVTPTGIVRHVHAIKGDPYNPGHVWMTTGDSGARIYRSTNYGATWTLLDSSWQGVQISFSPDWVFIAADSAVATVLVIDRTTLTPMSASPSYHHEIAVPGGATARTVTDLSCTAGAAGVTSATANFTQADKGRYLKHPYNGDFRWIQSVESATQATLSANANTNATNVTATISGDQFYDKAFFGAVDPATGIYYCIANDNSGAGTRSGLFVMMGVGEPLILVQSFFSQITGEMFIADGYLHEHQYYRPLFALG